MTRARHARTGAWRLALAVAFAGTALATAAAAAGDGWAVAGQQGLMRFVIVPVAQARDREAYREQIERLCEPERSCFLNFYTNSTDAPLGVPLPDAIDREATAVFRRSLKQGAELFRWSCRTQPGDDTCF